MAGAMRQFRKICTWWPQGASTAEARELGWCDHRCNRYRRHFHRSDRVRRPAPGASSQAKSLTTPAQLVQGIIDCIRRSGLDACRHRRADPRLDHRHQHPDRTQGRQDRPDRHPRHPRRVHHRPRQSAGGLQPAVPPPPAAGAAPSHARGRRAAAELRRSARTARSRRHGVEPAAHCRRRRGGGRGLLSPFLRQSRRTSASPAR